MPHLPGVVITVDDPDSARECAERLGDGSLIAPWVADLTEAQTAPRKHQEA
jgi:hypothetical protein